MNVGKVDLEIRKSMHCGWLKQAEWSETKQLPEKFGPFKYELPVCPGWLVHQPSCQQGLEAHAAREKGQLDLYFPEAQNTVLEAASAVASGFNAWEQERTDELRRQSG